MAPHGRANKSGATSRSRQERVAVLNETTERLFIMRSVFRRVLLALVAVVALGGVATASASASTREFIIEGSPISTGTTVPVETTYGTATVSFSGVTVECPTVTDESDFLAAGDSTSKVEMSGCLVQGAPGCTLKSPVVFRAHGELGTFAGEAADKLSPEVGEVLFSLVFQGGGCILGERKIVGYASALVSNAGTEETSHSLTFSGTSGSHLENGGGITLRLKGKTKLGGGYAGRKWSTRPAPEYLVKGSSITEVPFESKNVSGTVMTLSGGGVEVECKTANGTGKLLAEGASTSYVEYSSCSVISPTHCKVAEPIEDGNHNGQLLLYKGEPFDKFAQRSLILEFSGSECPLTYLELTGTSQGQVENSGTKAVEHTLVFKATTGEELELGGSRATLKAKEAIKLSGAFAGDEWDVS